MVVLCLQVCSSVFSGAPSASPPVIGGRVLGVPWGKQFPEATPGGGAVVENFIDDVTLRGFPCKVLPPCLTMEESSCVFGRARVKVTAQRLRPTLTFSAAQHPASLACVPSCGPLCGWGSWGCESHVAAWQARTRGSVGHGARERGGAGAEEEAVVGDLLVLGL